MKEYGASLLEATKNTVRTRPYPGYPTKRLVIEEPPENLTLPDGEWTTRVNILPSLDEQQELRDKGYELDDLGRPLHPWLREMLADPDVGVVTGMGEYWNWGPNYAADPIVINTDEDPKVLMIQRGDTGAWALPGGFIDGNETGAVAARRELFEETGLMITGEPIPIYHGIVADSRTTAHAWCETSAVLWRIEGTPDVKGLDDAIAAKWVPISELTDLHGSHKLFIEQALEHLDEVEPTHAMSLEAAKSYRDVSGGHMSYHRFIVETTNRRLFVKSHDKHAFTRSTSEAHSRQYLEKEKLMYDHVKRNGLKHAPASVELIDGISLMMEALTPEDGWYWRAPKPAPAFEYYMRDTIKALNKLQEIPMPDNFHDTILPTYDTHITEGWKAIDVETTEKIRGKISEYMMRMRPDFRHSAVQLRQNVESVQQQFGRITEPAEFFLCHHDMRQANLAWHTFHKSKLVDWSWAGAGRKNSDITTLLIDLHKSGRNVDKYMEHFNRDHALTLIGFWLAHSLWPTRSDDDTVRFQQIVSAVSAYDLLYNR